MNLWLFLDRFFARLINEGVLFLVIIVVLVASGAFDSSRGCGMRVHSSGCSP